MPEEGLSQAGYEYRDWMVDAMPTLLDSLPSVVSAWVVGFFFSFLFICGGTPANYWKSAKLEKAFCDKTQELHLASAVSDAILDILVILMPISMVSKHVQTEDLPNLKLIWIDLAPAYVNKPQICCNGHIFARLDVSMAGRSCRMMTG